MSAYLYVLEEKTLAEAKEITKAAISAIRKERLEDGIAVSGNVIPQISGERRADLKDAISAGVTEFQFKTEDGFVTLNAAGVEEILQARAVHTQSCFAKEKTLHDAVDSCEAVEEIASINVNDGWEVANG